MTALAPIVETQQLQSIDPVQRANAVVQSSTTGPVTDLLRIAVEKGTPVAELKELVDLHERMEQRQAQKDYSDAMARFQAECPPIKKGSNAKFATRSGGTMEYTYAGIDEIAVIVNPILAKFGLSYTWDNSMPGNTITCVCTVRHAHGHSEKSTIVLPTENQNGALSSQQKVAAAWTFARRLSLISVLGLTTTDDDIDGRDVDTGTITEEQADTLSALIAEANVDLAKFLVYMKVSTLADIPTKKYKSTLATLHQRKQGAKT